MSNALNKIAPNSPSRQNPSEIETSIANASRTFNPQFGGAANIAQALTDLENNVPDLKTSLRPLQFVSAREV
jgi:small subunit ribosomal protein S7e